MNKPVAWMKIETDDEGKFRVYSDTEPVWDDSYIPLYTHLVKELHLSLQKSQDGELLAVTYTDDEHRIVEVLWEKPPVKELTDEQILNLFEPKYDAEIDDEMLIDFARAILRKAQKK